MSNMSFSQRPAVVRETCPVCHKLVGPSASGKWLTIHGPRDKRCAGSLTTSAEQREREAAFARLREAMTPEEKYAEIMRSAW